MGTPTQSQQAERFRALHTGPRMLVLPNAWDAVSARLIEEGGFPAIATSSAGVAWALGYADGERISRGEMLAVVRRIAQGVRVPGTADVEAGHGATAEAAAAPPPHRSASSNPSACAVPASDRASSKPPWGSSAASPRSCASAAPTTRWPTW